MKEDADVICHALGFCRTDKGQPECKLRPNPVKFNKFKRYNLVKITLRLNFQQSIESRLINFKSKLREKNIELSPINIKVCEIPIFKKICDYIEKFVEINLIKNYRFIVF